MKLLFINIYSTDRRVLVFLNVLCCVQNACRVMRSLFRSERSLNGLHVMFSDCLLFELVSSQCLYCCDLTSSVWIQKLFLEVTTNSLFC